MCVCMYVCMYVCLYVVIRRPHVHRALCACAYRNSVKIVNVDRMLTLIVAHQIEAGASARTKQKRTASFSER